MRVSVRVEVEATGLRRISRAIRSDEVSGLQHVSVHRERSCGPVPDAGVSFARTPSAASQSAGLQSRCESSGASPKSPLADAEKHIHKGAFFCQKRVFGAICRFPNRSHTIPLNAPCTIARGCANIAADGTARRGICLQPCFDQEGQVLVPASGSGRGATPRSPPSLAANRAFRTMAV